MKKTFVIYFKKDAKSLGFSENKKARVKDKFFLNFSIIGTPSENEWPQNTSLLRSSFPNTLGIDLEAVVPEICNHGKDLLKVSF